MKVVEKTEVKAKIILYTIELFYDTSDSLLQQSSVLCWLATWPKLLLHTLNEIQQNCENLSVVQLVFTSIFLFLGPSSIMMTVLFTCSIVCSSIILAFLVGREQSYIYLETLSNVLNLKFQIIALFHFLAGIEYIEWYAKTSVFEFMCQHIKQ